MTLYSKMLGAASGIAMACTAFAAQAETLFWSTQAKPVEEAQAMREQVLSGFADGVDYQPNDGGPWLTRLQAELQAGSGTIGVLGALHGDFSAMNPDDLVDLSDMGVMSASGTFNDLAKLGTDSMQYIPWMQASYIMAANKDALQYLPDGADINALTYDQLIAWAANAHEAAGEPKFGFSSWPERSEAPLLPRLSLPVLHKWCRADVCIRRSRNSLGKDARTLGAHQPSLDQLLVHAGTATVGGCVDCV